MDKWTLPFADQVHFGDKALKKPLLQTQYNKANIICLHHTVSSSLKGTADFFEDPKELVGIHFLIGPKGEIWQLSPMNRVCSHAGFPWKIQSTGEFYPNINTCSIGIEVVNLGPLVKDKVGQFRDYWKQVYLGPVRHRELPEFTEYKYWVPFTSEQEKSVFKLVAWLMNRWEIALDCVLGHYEGTRRKNDPIGGFAIGAMPEVRKYIDSIYDDKVKELIKEGLLEST